MTTENEVPVLDIENLEQGRDYDISIEIVTDTDPEEPIKISGWVFAGKVFSDLQADDTFDMGFNVIDAELGQIVFTIPKEIIEIIDTGKTPWFYEIIFTDDYSKVRSVISGSLKVIKRRVRTA